MQKLARRDNFTSAIKTRLAKRAGFQCSICKAGTVGPSSITPESVTNIGVAAHITAAATGGPRYNPSLSTQERSHIRNGIWLCQNHAKLIDSDHGSWPASRLHKVKLQHEKFTADTIGLPKDFHSKLDISIYTRALSITPREYAFANVRELIEPYRNFLSFMLKEQKLTEESEMGILMCGSPPECSSQPDYETPCTAFVNADWLRWHLSSKEKGFETAQEVSPRQIYGVIPAWPDSFYEFLQALVQTNTTFKWQWHQNGYLVLAQQ